MLLAITRCSLLTPLDDGARGTWEALLAGARVEEKFSVADELLDPDESLDRAIRLALAIARRAVKEVPRENLALFCGTSKGPAVTMLRALERLRHREPLTMEQAQQIALGVGAMGTILGERLGLEAGHTSVAACSSGLHALHRAAQALRRGECERALVVAADASAHELFEGSFARLGVLAPKDERGVRRCAPFSSEGRGFFLAEAAAALLLEKQEAVENRKSKIENPPLAWLEHSWIGADSTGLIAIDPSAAALRCGLAECALAQRPAFVHAHATGTEHDRFELQAIRAIAGEATPVFSHKAWLGHSLGAAGLVSVALSALAHHHGRLPTGEPIAGKHSSLTIAQGFGGHIGIVRLRGHSI